jgi:hypothetical protein
MNTRYDTDVIAWATEQAALLRSGRLAEIDIEHIAEEIEDVGKSEKRELASRLAVLMAHLLKWQFQPGRRGTGWHRAIKEQRRAIAAHLLKTPSLQVSLDNGIWFDGVWSDAIVIAIDETGLDLFPNHCPWTIDQVLNAAFYPDDRAARVSAGAKHRIGAHVFDQDGVISNTEGLL